MVTTVTAIKPTQEQQEKEKSMEIVLSGEQKALLDIMENSSQHMFITGRAGAGKSVLLRSFREETQKSIVIAAPTGIAALNVQGQTIHSLFKLPPTLYQGNLDDNPRANTLLKRINTLVIDEISMVRADLLDAINERFQQAHKNKLPFGGVQLIMFGDVYQLPPVVENKLAAYFEQEYGGYFFFNAQVWKTADFKVYELSQVFRQKDPIFKDALNAIRDGSYTEAHIAGLNARYGFPVPADGTVTLAPTNNLVSRINQDKLDRLPGQVRTYNATITGNMKQGSFPTEEYLQVKEGAQIVMLKNDKNGRWVNGTVGKIAKLNDNSIEVKIGEIVYTLERESWEEISYSYDEKSKKIKKEVVASFTQYPVRLAWALTIHKSQGQTYQSVALDLTTPTFAPGQMYVALSRATSLEGLYLKQIIKSESIIVDKKVQAFMSRREKIAIETAPEAEQAAQVAEVDTTEPATGKRPYGGRKASADQDKKVPLQFMIDPSIKSAFQDFVTALKESGDFAEIVPGAGNSLSEADVLTQALLSFAPFKAYFETSPQAEVYADRLARQEQAREEYANRKRGKKAAEVAPVAPDPDDGGNGGGAPVSDLGDDAPAFGQGLSQFFDRAIENANLLKAEAEK